MELGLNLGTDSDLYNERWMIPISIQSYFMRYDNVAKNFAFYDKEEKEGAAWRSFEEYHEPNKFYLLSPNNKDFFYNHIKFKPVTKDVMTYIFTEDNNRIFVQDLDASDSAWKDMSDTKHIRTVLLSDKEHGKGVAFSYDMDTKHLVDYNKYEMKYHMRHDMYLLSKLTVTLNMKTGKVIAMSGEGYHGNENKEGTITFD